MDIGITRKKALDLVDEHIKDPITKLHLIESEAIMRAVAKRLGEDEENWGILALVHDIDWELTKNDVKNHGLKMREILGDAGMNENTINIIESHIYPNGSEENYIGNDGFVEKRRNKKVEYALAASETATGLVVACALVQPDKKLKSVKVPSIMKKFKQPSFARNCSRETMKESEKLGLTLEEFFEISLSALQNISGELGL